MMTQSTKTIRTIKIWIPPIASLCAVIVAGGFALVRKTAVSEDIREMNDLGVSLTATATGIQRGTLSPQQTKALLEEKGRLEARIRDADKPGKVVQQLSEFARKVGLHVLQIQPVQRRAGKRRGAGLPQSLYRISVRGSYQKIAAYLEGCKARRIPLRIVALRMTSTDEAGQVEHVDLRAEITVETLCSMASEQEGSVNN